MNSQGISFKFKDWTLDAYRRVLENEMIWRGFLNSFFYSTAFTVISVFVTLLAAYPMSKKNLWEESFLILFLSSPCFWRRSDTYIYSGESAPYGKYGLGDFASGSIQCMEYDFGEERIISLFQKNFEKRQLLTEQMKSSTFSGSCFQCVNRSLQFWHYGLFCGNVEQLF